jgi:predicted  nucleic acid-binding Zn-ribbon protein
MTKLQELQRIWRERYDEYLDVMLNVRKLENDIDRLDIEDSYVSDRTEVVYIYWMEERNRLFHEIDELESEARQLDREMYFIESQIKQIKNRYMMVLFRETDCSS